MNAELNKVILTKDFKYTEHFFWRVVELYLPTEAVVRSPQIVVPQVARFSCGEFYWWNDKLVDYNTILDSYPNKKDFPGAGPPNVGILELWHDTGDDGHIDYKLFGFSFVKVEDIESYLQKKEYPVDFVNHLECSMRD